MLFRGGAEERIAKIIKTYQPREEVARYISAAVEATDIDLEKTHDELVAIEASILAAKEKHNSFLKDLGLRPLP